jgi:hypothetical protein
MLKQLAGLEHKPTTVSLRTLTATVLGRCIQAGEHDSVEDARAAMDLYRRVEKDWEAELLLQATTTSHITADSNRSTDTAAAAAAGASAACESMTSCSVQARQRLLSESNSFLADSYWPPDLLVT